MYFFITSTKGFGKTYLLLAKRNSIQEMVNKHENLYSTKGIKIIPENRLRDRPFGSVSLSQDVIAKLKIHETFDILWSLSIILTCIKVSSLDLSKVHGEVQKLLKSTSKTPFSYFKRLLAILGTDKRLFFVLQEQFNTDLMDLYGDIHQPIYMFLDDMDEYFEAHIDRRISLGETAPEVWFNAQTSLIRISSQLMKSNHHIKIFIGIRKEALSTLPKLTADSLQIGSKVIDLNYDQDELKHIFIAHIKNEQSKKLIIPEKIELDPIVAFLGIDCITNYVIEPQVEENVFDYIYRHTLQRPRDIVGMGHELRKISPEKRNEENIKRIVNRYATEIANQYIAEVNPFQKYDLMDIIRFIPSTVFRSEELGEKCAEFHDSVCPNLNCQKCEYDNIFYTLYKVGLLGYVHDEVVHGKKLQRFVKPGDKPIEDGNKIPDSSYYLVHPVIHDIVSEMNPDYIIDRFNYVGQNLEWNDSQRYKKVLDEIETGFERDALIDELKHLKEQIENMAIKLTQYR